jgi:hypothetical protein
MRRLSLVLAFVISTAAIAAGGAGSATSKSTFDVLVEPSMSGASNGLILETELAGLFDVVAKSATGEGSWKLFAGTSEIDHGSFTLTGLVSFQFYGCGEVTGVDPNGNPVPIPLESDFCGGRVTFTVDAVSDVTHEHHSALYEVNCQIHDPGGQAPPGTSEGVKVNAEGVNFNKHVGEGDNLLIMTS